MPWPGRAIEPPADRDAAPCRAALRVRELERRDRGALVAARDRHERVVAAGRGAATRKTGFETELVAPAGARYAAVVALDADGKPLARSKAVKFT